jgi:PAS domain S-box-containing protein
MVQLGFADSSVQMVDPVARPKVLIIGEAHELREMEKALAPLRLDVVPATTTEDALVALVIDDFALVLLDVQAPGLDGFETVTAIKKRDRAKHVPIIFMGAFDSDAEAAIHGYSMGAVDAIKKPVNAQLLRAKVSVFVDLHHANVLVKEQAAELLRREMELVRREGERRYRDLAESMPQIVWTADAEGQLTYRNQHWDRTSGTSGVGDSGFREILHPDDVGPFLAHWNHAIACGEGFNADFRFGDPAVSNYRWHLVRVIARSDDEGRVVQFIGTSTDIDDRRKAEEATRRLADALDEERRKLVDANVAKDEFLAVLSHELRTPLNAVLGWTKLLRAGDLGEAASARALETIERNARSQAQLVADLLDVSRIVSGKLRIERTSVDMAEVVETAVDALKPFAAQKGVDLESRIDPYVGVVNGDRERLNQIVANLISNALKFTPAEGRVTVHLSRDGSARAKLLISDTGKGIAAEFLPHLFLRFRQAESASTRRHGGLGLGLAIVRHLVEIHGGTVRAASEGVGRGSSFTVELPVVPAPSDSQRMLNGDLDSLEGIDILLVDDEPDGRAVACAILSRTGAVVRAVASVTEALAAIEQNVPNVLVSDIGMPERDGYSFIRELRSLPAVKGGTVPAIALTAYASRDDEARAVDAGFDMHISKPVDPDVLHAAVARLLRRRGTHSIDGVNR